MSTWIDENSKDDLKLGYSRDLARDHAPDVLKSQVEAIINPLKMKCFNHYSSIFDGTSSFTPTEAITVRAVTNQYHIVQVLVRIGLFQ